MAGSAIFMLHSSLRLPMVTSRYLFVYGTLMQGFDNPYAHL